MRLLKTRHCALDKPGLSSEGVPSQVPPSFSFILLVWCQMNTSSNDRHDQGRTDNWLNVCKKTA